jgi:hypothetical protein
MSSNYTEGAFQIPGIDLKAEGKDREGCGPHSQEELGFEVKGQEQDYDELNGSVYDMEGESLW